MANRLLFILATGTLALGAMNAASPHDQSPEQATEYPAASESVAPLVGAADFVKAAARSGHFEIASGRMAFAKSENQAVQEFARMMIEDHQRMNEQLTQACALSVTGQTLDAVYVANRIAGHKPTIASCEYKAENGEARSLRTLARGALPKLRPHLQQAEASVRDTGAP